MARDGNKVDNVETANKIWYIKNKIKTIVKFISVRISENGGNEEG